MDVMIVVDMQVGLLDGPPKHDLPGVIDRLNALAAKLRDEGGTVIWIRHCGAADEGFAPGSAGWQFLPGLLRGRDDRVVEKRLNDPYVGTPLQAIVDGLAPRRVLVGGWATDFCVDATVRSTVSRGHAVVVVSDGHTLADRPHLAAPAVIAHHNWVWRNLITERSIDVMPADALLAGA